MDATDPTWETEPGIGIEDSEVANSKNPIEFGSGTTLGSQIQL